MTSKLRKRGALRKLDAFATRCPRLRPQAVLDLPFPIVWRENIRYSRTLTSRILVALESQGALALRSSEDAMRPLRLLIATDALLGPTDPALYVRDVAIGFLARGHQPVVYAPQLGAIADELRQATVPVTDRLSSLGVAPDIIQGHHDIETMAALLQFPDVPATYFCESWPSWRDGPLHFPRIGCYIVVDIACFNRLLCEAGIPEAKLRHIPSFVDTERFPLRTDLPERPARALAIKTADGSDRHVPGIAEACLRAGLELDVACEWPLTTPPYDLVFASGWRALEAMAAGAAVVLCSDRGLGPMVTEAEFDFLHSHRFGDCFLVRPAHTEEVLQQISRYSAADGIAVSVRARTAAGRQAAIDRLLPLYGELIQTAEASGGNWRSESRAASAYLCSVSPRIQEALAEKPRRECEELRRQCDQLRQDRDRQHADSLELAKKRDEFQTLYDYFKFEHDFIKPERDHLVRENGRLQEERQSLQKENVRLQEERQSLEKENHTLRLRQQQVEEQLQTGREEHERLLTERAVLLQERGNLCAERERLLAEREFLLAELDRQSAEVATMVSENNTLRQQLTRLQGENTRLREESSRLLDAQRDLQEQLAEAAAERTDLYAHQERTRAEREKLQGELHAVYSSISVRVRERLLATPVLGRVTRLAARHARSIKRWLAHPRRR